MWALAAVWHLLGNPLTASAPAQVLLVVGAGAVLWRPGRVGPLAVLALGGVVTMWSEAPALGNHWLLAALVDLALLLAVAVGVARRRWDDATDLADRFLPVARLCLLGFYFFASFAKLNSAFFDRSVSCATFYFRESTDSVGPRRSSSAAPPGSSGRSSWRPRSIELSIPWLLLVPPHPPPRRGRGARLPRRAGDRPHPPVLRLLVGAGRALRALPALRLRACGWPSGSDRSGPGSLLRDERAPRLVHLGARRGRRCWPGWRSCSTSLTPRPGPPGRVVAVAGVRGGAPRRDAPVPPAAPAGAGPAALRVGHVVFLLVPLLVRGQRAHPVPRAEDRLRLEHVRQPAHGRRRDEPLPGPADPAAHRRPGRPRRDPRLRRPGPPVYRDNELLAHLAAAARLPVRPPRHPDPLPAAAPRSSPHARLGRSRARRPLPLWQEKLQLFRAVDERVAGALPPHVRPPADR